jgi:hypothetical protein
LIVAPIYLLDLNVEDFLARMFFSAGGAEEDPFVKTSVLAGRNLLSMIQTKKERKKTKKKIND